MQSIDNEITGTFYSNKNDEETVKQKLITQLEKNMYLLDQLKSIKEKNPVTRLYDTSYHFQKNNKSLYCNKKPILFLSPKHRIQLHRDVIGYKSSKNYEKRDHSLPLSLVNKPSTSLLDKLTKASMAFIPKFSNVTTNTESENVIIKKKHSSVCETPYKVKKKLIDDQVILSKGYIDNGVGLFPLTKILNNQNTSPLAIQKNNASFSNNFNDSQNLYTSPKKWIEKTKKPAGFMSRVKPLDKTTTLKNKIKDLEEKSHYNTLLKRSNLYISKNVKNTGHSTSITSDDAMSPSDSFDSHEETSILKFTNPAYCKKEDILKLGSVLFHKARSDSHTPAIVYRLQKSNIKNSFTEPKSSHVVSQTSVRNNSNIYNLTEISQYEGTKSRFIYKDRVDEEDENEKVWTYNKKKNFLYLKSAKKQ